MVNRIPEYLRLHTDDETSPVVEMSKQKIFSLDVLCQAFAEVTGADLQYGSLNSLPAELDWFMEIENSRPHRCGGELGQPVAFGIRNGTGPALPPDTVRKIEHLAGEIGCLTNRLHRTERALWEREAELAVGIPVTAHPEFEGEQIAERLESILRCGVEAIGCTAAALFVLDEGTTELKRRVQWGFEIHTFTEPAKALRGARADLEALTGHAIVVESRDELNFWDLPEEFAAAVCVPVASMTMPLGTLWIYSETPRTFSDVETNLIEIIAGRIAVELEREVLVRDAANRRSGDYLDGAIAWQQRMVPTAPPVADGWDFAASTSYQNGLNGDHCFWHSCGDGRVLATVSSIVGDVPEIALTASLLSGTIRGLCESRLVADVVAGVNRTLWSSSDGDLLASIFASEIDPRSGKICFVATGDIGAFIIRPHGWEGLPINDAYCGSDELLQFQTFEREMLRDDILVAMSSPRGHSPRLASMNLELQHLAEVALHHMHLTSKELIELLRKECGSINPLCQSPPALLVVKRSG